MALGNPFNVIKNLLSRRRRRQQSLGSRRDSTAQTNDNERQRSPVLSPRPKLSAATKRARITRHLDRLHDEGVELDTKLLQLRGVVDRAAAEHDALVGRLEDLRSLEERLAQNQFAQESYLHRLLCLCGLRKRLGRITQRRHTGLGKLRLQRRLIRVTSRRAHVQLAVESVMKLKSWLDEEVKIQKSQQETAEDDNDGSLDLDESLIETLDEQRAIRQMTQKKQQDGGQPLTKQHGNHVLCTRLQGEPPSGESSSCGSAAGRLEHSEAGRFPAMAEVLQPRAAHHRLRDQTCAPETVHPRNLSSRGSISSNSGEQIPSISHERLNHQPAAMTANPLPSLRRLSIRTPAPMPCLHNQWLPRDRVQSTCQACEKSVLDRIYYCPRCPAEVCPPCFQAGQPNGGRVAISGRIFSTAQPPCGRNRQ